METFDDMIGAVYLGATTQGMDLSQKDVGWICSTFLEAMLAAGIFPEQQRPMLQKIADACSAVEDER